MSFLTGGNGGSGECGLLPTNHAKGRELKIPHLQMEFTTVARRHKETGLTDYVK